jgi:hypothetical protein
MDIGEILDGRHGNAVLILSIDNTRLIRAFPGGFATASGQSGPEAASDVNLTSIIGNIQRVIQAFK